MFKFPGNILGRILEIYTLVKKDPVKDSKIRYIFIERPIISKFNINPEKKGGTKK